MSDSLNQDSASISERPELSDDLPPVQPPSAGFIIQLFVVPGLIVLAVVAVWALFGRIAASEQDWRKLVTELQSPNSHIRNRAMYGLAQVLDQDRRKGEQGQQLSSNPEIAIGLSDQLVKELKSGSTSREGLALQQYLTRAMGLLDPSDEVSTAADGKPATSGAPVRSDANAAVATALKMALEPARDIEIRKSAAASIAFIAGRALEREQPLEAPDLVEALIDVANDQQTIMRQAAAFALGLFRSPEATHQLQVMLGNDDWMTRVNAAIALSRSGSTEGLPVFKQALTMKAPTTADEQSEQILILKNSLKALSELGPKMSSTDKDEFRGLTEELIRTQGESRIRVEAQNALNSLK